MTNLSPRSRSYTLEGSDTNTRVNVPVIHNSHNQLTNHYDYDF